MVFTIAQYGAAGTGLRNRIASRINLSGVVPPVQAAFLYWGVLEPSATDTPSTNKLIIEQVVPPVSASVTLTGTLIGTGADTCWGSNHASFYRAAVPLSVATELIG